jgi:hypothetical protein
VSVLVLDPAAWRARLAAHEMRIDRWLAPHLERRRSGVKHPVEDFLFTYYSYRPANCVAGTLAPGSYSPERIPLCGARTTSAPWAAPPWTRHPWSAVDAIR